MREIAIYRQSLDESSAMEFNDALARFGIETETEFRRRFPNFDPNLFRVSPLWLVLVGAGVKSELSKVLPTEVEMWLEERVAGFFESL